MQIEVKADYYSKKDCQANPMSLYVFGDNTVRKGSGGQAIIRGELNSIGIATKLKPSNSDEEFMSDNDLQENKKIINNDIYRIKELYNNAIYNTIVFPYAGLGTGLSQMQVRCPRTFMYLNERLLDEFGFNNMMSLKTV
jgi:hypothetical protein